MKKKNKISFKVDLKNLANSLQGRNFGDIEIFAQSVMRRYVLSLPNNDIASFVKEELKKLELNIS